MLQFLNCRTTIVNANPDSLFENNLRGPLAVHSEAAIRQFDDCAHGLADRVECVDFVKLLFWELVPYWLVIPLQVQDQSQQAAFCLVSHLFRQTAFLIWRLEGSRGNVYFKDRFHAKEQQHSLPDHDFHLGVLLHRNDSTVKIKIFFSSHILCKLFLSKLSKQTFTDLCSSNLALSFCVR